MSIHNRILYIDDVFICLLVLYIAMAFTAGHTIYNNATQVIKEVLPIVTEQQRLDEKIVALATEQNALQLLRTERRRPEALQILGLKPQTDLTSYDAYNAYRQLIDGFVSRARLTHPKYINNPDAERAFWGIMNAARELGVGGAIIETMEHYTQDRDDPELYRENPPSNWLVPTKWIEMQESRHAERKLEAYFQAIGQRSRC